MAATTISTKEDIPTDYLQSPRPTRIAASEAKFVAYQASCHDIFGLSPSLHLVFEREQQMFHEAAVFVPGETEDALFVTSNKSTNDIISIFKLTRQGRNNTTWQVQEIPDCGALMGNGGVNYPASRSVLFCAQGAPGHPSSLTTMDIDPPYRTQQLLTSYHGRLFNSVNDVIVAEDGAIWFTDPTYGYEQGFRPKPQLPCQVYRFDPANNDIRVVADGIEKPNGLCFSPDERILYVTDTAWMHGSGETHDARRSHIYAYAVEMVHGSPFLTNRRVFAMADTGIPDGIKCDTLGNVYSGCGDGVNIWAPTGTLIGKIIVPGSVANFCFGRPGELMILNETRFWVANIAEGIHGALLQGLDVNVK